MSQSNPDKAEAAEERTEQILCTTSQIGYAAQVHLRREDRHSPRRLPSRGHGKRSVQARGDQALLLLLLDKEFMEAGKERLARDSVRDATRQEIHALKRENGELKQLVADLSLEAYRLKETALPMMEDGAGTSA